MNAAVVQISNLNVNSRHQESTFLQCKVNCQFAREQGSRAEKHCVCFCNRRIFVGVATAGFDCGVGRRRAFSPQSCGESAQKNLDSKILANCFQRIFKDTSRPRQGTSKSAISGRRISTGVLCHCRIFCGVLQFLCAI